MRCFILSIFILLPALAYAQVTYSMPPVGFYKLDIGAGTGGARKVSLISVPLHGKAQIFGAVNGSISSVGSSSIVCTNAQWLLGELSNPEMPYALAITSGSEEGRIFLISSTSPNNSDTLFIDSSELVRHGPLDNLNIAQGDRFAILPVETLSSFFGSPETTLIKGGDSPRQADLVTLLNNGSAYSYYYNTTLGRWARVGLGNSNANNVPLLPYYGIQYSRLESTPLQFLVMGSVPLGKRVVPVRDYGSTLLAHYWMENKSLIEMDFQSIGNWRSGLNSTNSDVVSMGQSGSVSSYRFDGVNWRRVSLGNPLANNTILPMSSSFFLNRKGDNSGYSIYSDSAPY